MDVSDDRGQALQVGAILLFGILIVGLSLYQATVVPGQNERVEFDAYLDANSDMEQLDSEVTAAAARDYSTRTAVQTGVQYPTRTIFINPGPPGNRLRTGDTQTVYIKNASAVSGEETNTRTYWNGTTRTYNTTNVTFDTDYNQLRAPPIVYESGVIHRPTDTDESIVVSDGSLIEGNRITLVTLEGDVDAGGMSPTIVAEPVSAHTRTVVVTGNNSNNVTLTVPSRLSADTWNEEIVGNRSDVTVTENGSHVDIDLNGSKTYELRLARVELRRQSDSGVASEPDPEYVVDVAGDGESIPQNQSIKLTAEVRDRYNNPKRGTEVTFSTTDGTFAQNSNQTRDVTTDGEGRANVEFEPGSTGELEVVARISGGASPELNTQTFTVNVNQGGGAGGGGSGGAATNPSSDLAALVWQNATGAKNDDVVEVSFENTDQNNPITLQEVRYQFYNSDEQGNNAPPAPSSANITDENANTAGPIDYLGPYESVSELSDISKDSSVTYTFEFYEDDGTSFDADPGDFFVISIRYELDGDTNTATYFIGIAGSN